MKFIEARDRCSLSRKELRDRGEYHGDHAKGLRMRFSGLYGSDRTDRHSVDVNKLNFYDFFKINFQTTLNNRFVILN